MLNTVLKPSEVAVILKSQPYDPPAFQKNPVEGVSREKGPQGNHACSPGSPSHSLGPEGNARSVLAGFVTRIPHDKTKQRPR